MFIGHLFGQNSDGEERIDYDLKGNGEDGLVHDGESSDFEEWWGVERDNGKSSDHDSDDDEPSGGEMLPVFDY